MVHSCCVPNCTSSSRNQTTIGNRVSFHSFPSELRRREEWLVATKLSSFPNTRITKSTLVCSLHFEEKCFIMNPTLGKKRFLTKKALPTIFSWSDITIKEQAGTSNPIDQFSADIFSLSQISTGTFQGPLGNIYTGMDIQSPSEKSVLVTEVPLMQPPTSPSKRMVEALLSDSSQTSLSASQSTTTSCSQISLLTLPSPSKATLKEKNTMLLELRQKEKFSLLRFLSDNSIKYYTGLPSYQHFWTIYQFLLPEANFLNYVGKLGKTQDEDLHNPKPGPARKLNPMEEFFVTLVRLRKGLPERVIADLYNISVGYVSKIINTWVIFLANRFQYLPIWPTKEQIQETTPKKIREAFPNLRVIIDCTEFYIQMPSASDSQRETFSSYKHRNTVKALVGITPNGHLTYYSNLYAGRTSDKKIVRHCGILDKLEEGDMIMADRGFDITKDLEARNISLAIPHFLAQRDQFTEEEVKEDREVSQTRIHVERAIRRIREFQILDGTIPITLAPMLENIYFICCHLSNFTGSLVKQ